nr:hypothetical protein [Deltaproteobacteria bacterium]
ALRKAGENLKRIAADSGTKTAITGAAVALGASTAGVSAVAAAVAQVAGVIGKAIAGANDKSLGEAMGTIVVPENRSVPREEDTIEGTNFDVDMDYFLFDAARDEDSEANLGVHIEVDSQGKFQLVE